MSKFDHLVKGLEVDCKTPRPYKFELVAGMVEIMFLPALEGNDDYADASLLFAQKKGRDKNRKGKVNAKKEMKRARREDMAMFAKYCAVDWTGVVDIKGTPVKFTKADCFDFLVAMPVRYQDALRGWIRSSANFIPEPVKKDDDDEGDFDLSDLDDLDDFDLDSLDEAIEQERSGAEEETLGKPSEGSSSGKGATAGTKGKSADE